MVDETAKLMSETGMRLDPAERRLLAGMPLHAITSVHGEAGLRERLHMEIAQFPAPDRGRVTDALVLASLEASPWARVIKALDFTDNAVGIIHTTGPKLAKLARKYSPLVPILRELILRPDTPLDADVKNMIAGQLDNAQGRFAAIWHGHDADGEASQPFGAQPGSS